MEPGKSPLGNCAGPGEWLSVGAGLVRNKQAAAPIQRWMSRSGPAAGAQGVGGRRGAGVKSSSDSTRYSSSLALSSQTGRGSPHSALSSAQATHSGLCSQAHWEGGKVSRTIRK